MKLASIDIIIIFAYLILTILLGFWIAKKAAKNLDSYFLGGKSLPWYLLGLSNASGMFDITGTMWMVAIMFIYGIKSVFIPWLWPVWNQVFLMIFLAVWLRRSNVLTGAEWLKTRFGDSKGSRMSHISVVIFALVAVVGFIAYAFEGIGKFSVMFLPWDLSATILGLTISSERMYALIIMGITTLYVVKGGMYSVVLTEVMQFFVMTVSCIIIGIIAMRLVSPDQLQALVPEGWLSLSPDWNLDISWSSFTENINRTLNEKIGSDGYELFSVFLMIVVFRGILVSIAGPVPGYDMQRVLATRNPKESALMSWFVSLVLFIPRYMMIAGLAIIAIVYFNPDFLISEGQIDFEKVLPFALTNFIPAGVLGIILAGLIAAFMSTFAANVNAGPAYIVNDIYKKFIRPEADQKTLIRLSYISSILVVIAGIVLGFFVSSINSLLQWITAALFGGYAAANFLKWIWWRFNGYGYFWGMISGLVVSLILPRVLPDLSIIIAFPMVILPVSTLGSLLGCLLTRPDDIDVLKKFYTTVRPWGFWSPVYRQVVIDEPGFKKNLAFKRDMFNSLIGIIWQMMLILSPIYLVVRNYPALIICIVVLAITSIILKFNWFDKLESD
jgi:SSS family solute:Na+ symporter